MLVPVSANWDFQLEHHSYKPMASAGLSWNTRGKPEFKEQPLPGPSPRCWPAPHFLETLGSSEDRTEARALAGGTMPLAAGHLQLALCR